MVKEWPGESVEEEEEDEDEDEDEDEASTTRFPCLGGRDGL